MADNPMPAILQTTLGELLRNNKYARSMIMKSMQIEPEQLNDMISRAEANQMMNMTVSELFQKGLFQQAETLNQSRNTNNAPLNLTDEHLALVAKSLQNSEAPPEKIIETKTPVSQSFFQKLSNFFKQHE